MYLPWALCAFELLLGGVPLQYFAGIFTVKKPSLLFFFSFFFPSVLGARVLLCDGGDAARQRQAQLSANASDFVRPQKKIGEFLFLQSADLSSDIVCFRRTITLVSGRSIGSSSSTAGATPSL